MNIISKQEKVMHNYLTKVFSSAFAQAQKEGVNVKNLYWFNSESEKNAKDSAETRRTA